MVKIFNKGKRTFEYDKNPEDKIKGKSFKDVPEKIAERLLKGYPKEIINAKDFEGSSGQNTAIKLKKLTILEKSNKELEGKNEKLEEENKKLKEGAKK